MNDHDLRPPGNTREAQEMPDAVAARLDDHAAALPDDVLSGLHAARSQAVELAAISTHLERHADTLTPAAHARLAQARRAAVARAGRPVGTGAGWYWLGGGAVAAALALVLVLPGALREPDGAQPVDSAFAQAAQAPPMPAGFDEEPQVQAAADMDVLAQMEFLAWLHLEVGSEPAEAG